MVRRIVNVATDSWSEGQRRLIGRAKEYGENVRYWANQFPPGCPPHRQHGSLAAPLADCVPYAFKAYALKHAADAGDDLLLWCDACINPIRPLDSLWEKIERDGYFVCDNGWTNYQWTADSAYPDLFPESFIHGKDHGFEEARETNKKISHVVATCFGLNVRHPLGALFLGEYYRLASGTRAFCGPWQNELAPSVAGRNTDRVAGTCGPPDVLGHRHDQTAASVIAWRLGFKLTQMPDVFSYVKRREDGSYHFEDQDPRTLLVADGDYR